jgi:thioredoxin 1
LVKIKKGIARNDSCGLCCYSLSSQKNVFLTHKTDKMSKFGELIDANIPILLSFYTDWNDPSVDMHPVLRDVAAAMGDYGKVVKIDVDKNPKLAEALRIKGLPTLMIYKSGEMVWRQSGEQDANTLIGLMKDFV